MDNRQSIDGMGPRRDVPSAPPLPQDSEPNMGPEPVTAAEPAYAEPSPVPTPIYKPHPVKAVEAPELPPEPPSRNPLLRFFAGYWRHKLWTMPLMLFVVAAAVFAIPSTRYPILAIGMKRSFSVTVSDAKTNTPVSGAEVRMDGMIAQTSSSGRALFTTPVGKQDISVSKKYYQHTNTPVFVGVSRGHNSLTVQLTATGRQVPLSVVDKITGKGVAEARIRVLDTEARTDARGTATLVLPTNSATQTATIDADGYNGITVSVQVTNAVVPANTLTLTPSGKVYFLSNQSGNVDVVSTNLDGSGRKTVLAGTGSEDPNNTQLLATHDWTNLALLSKRGGGQYAKLYLISTKDGKLTTIDNNEAQFTPIGWSDHVFVYQSFHGGANSWEDGQSVLMSYDADGNKSATIDQTHAIGTTAQYIRQTLSFVNIIGSRVVYAYAWDDANGNYVPNSIGGQKNVIMSANVDGSNKQTLREITISNGITSSYMTSVQLKPQELDIQESAGTQPSVYYTYQPSNNSITQSSTLTDSSYQQIQQSLKAYLVSPTGKSTLWDQTRDGKNTLFVGDNNGGSGQQIGDPDVYAPFGWYTDSYLLVQKGSELYVMPVGGGTPVKLSDFDKTSNGNYYTYGGNGSLSFAPNGGA